MKFDGELGCGLETNWLLHFGNDPYHYPDPGVRSGCLSTSKPSSVILSDWCDIAQSVAWYRLGWRHDQHVTRASSRLCGVVEHALWCYDTSTKPATDELQSSLQLCATVYSGISPSARAITLCVRLRKSPYRSLFLPFIERVEYEKERNKTRWKHLLQNKVAQIKWIQNVQNVEKTYIYFCFLSLSVSPICFSCHSCKKLLAVFA